MLNRKRNASLLLAVSILSSLIFPSEVFAQKRVVPVVDVSSGCLMGGLSGGKWLEAKDAAALMQGGERYSVYELTRRIGVRTGSKPSSEGAPCDDTLYVKMSRKDERSNLIGVGGEWNALPRVPKSVSTRSPVYRAAVAEALRRNGIARPQVKIVKVLRIDLDGDGTDEVLINATRAKRWASGSISNDYNPGDYSVVLLRKVIKGKAETIVIEGEYHPKPRNPETDGPPDEYEIAAVLDLNGDGRMEVIVAGGYYEGNWKTAYTVNGRKVESVMNCGCGA